MDQLNKENPKSRILCVINTNLKPGIDKGILCAAEHYSAWVVELRDIDKSNGHPTKLGMSQIAEQTDAAILGK